MNDSDTRSLYLFADSQPLFWEGGAFLADLCRGGASSHPNVAYIGASNGDSADAHAIFTAAFAQVPTASTHWVRADFNNEDRAFLHEADVIVLAGGDVEAGWDVFIRTGLRESLHNCYRDGAILLGVSAGAVQFGRYATVADSNGAQKLVETLGLLNVIVDVHDEKRDWHGLSSTIQLLEGALRGIGIPHGAALVVHPDGTYEPLGRPVEEFVLSGGRLRRSVLLADIRNGDEVVS
ncbi:MAG: Type 1 glutamine amidotransferase-like domain-containing protein [Proteobacteria bacterium]|nr:Type 1 glutamine amidotransferase-like domain-containing protein [Pseudomonadota bacterium]